VCVLPDRDSSISRQHGGGSAASHIVDVFDDVFHGVCKLDGMYLIDESGRDEEGDDGTDVEDEEHAVQREGDQTPLHCQSLLGVTSLQLHHERLQHTLDFLHLVNTTSHRSVRSFTNKCWTVEKRQENLQINRIEAVRYSCIRHLPTHLYTPSLKAGPR